MKTLGIRRAPLPLLLAALCLTGVAPVQAQEGELKEKIDAALAKLPTHVRAAVQVRSVASGAALYERESDLALIPASNLKLVTTAAALAKLGPDHKFQTLVRAIGDRKGEVLDGDLILVGGGDPTLTPQGLRNLAEQVQRAGIRRITGSLRLDASRFPNEPHPEPKTGAVELEEEGEPESEGIQPEVSADPFATRTETDCCSSCQASCLSVSALRVSSQALVFAGERPGDPVRILLPAAPLPLYLRLDRAQSQQEVVTGELGSPIRIRSHPGGGARIVLSGSLPVGAVAAVGFASDEPEFAGELFRQALIEKGVQLDGPVVPGATPDSYTPQSSPTSPSPSMSESAGDLPPVIGSLDSQRLIEIIRVTNKSSCNAKAEAILREVGRVVGGMGNRETGLKVVREWLASVNIGLTGQAVTDGSGCSRANAITARSLNSLLLVIRNQPWSSAFFDTLPISGTDGTLSTRMLSVKGKVHAKTGTLAVHAAPRLGATALSGYAQIQDGTLVVFSILSNGYRTQNERNVRGRGLENEIGTLLAKFKP